MICYCKNNYKNLAYMRMIISNIEIAKVKLTPNLNGRFFKLNLIFPIV